MPKRLLIRIAHLRTLSLLIAHWLIPTQIDTAIFQTVERYTMCR